MGLKQDPQYKALLADKAIAIEKSDKETELRLAASIYDWLGKKALADSLNNIIKAKFPKGETVSNEAANAIIGAKEIGRKDSLYKDFMAKYPGSKNPDLDFTGIEIVTGYLQAGNYAAAEKYAALVQKKSSLANTYNGIAYEWALEGIHLEQAENLSKQSLDIILDEQKHPKAMPFYSPRELDKLYANMYNKCADSYAYILYLQKKYNEALKYQQEVYAYDQKHRLTIVEHYALILNKLSKYDESKNVIENFLKTGECNDILYNELKKAYVGLNRSEAGFKDYFEVASKQRMN